MYEKERRFERFDWLTLTQGLEMGRASSREREVRKGGGLSKIWIFEAPRLFWDSKGGLGTVAYIIYVTLYIIGVG